MTSTTTPSSTTPPLSNEAILVASSAIGTVGVLLLFIMVALIVLVCYCRKKDKLPSQSDAIDMAEQGSYRGSNTHVNPSPILAPNYTRGEYRIVPQKSPSPADDISRTANEHTLLTNSQDSLRSHNTSSHQSINSHCTCSCHDHDHTSLMPPNTLPFARYGYPEATISVNPKHFQQLQQEYCPDSDGVPRIRFVPPTLSTPSTESLSIPSSLIPGNFPGQPDNNSATMKTHKAPKPMPPSKSEEDRSRSYYSATSGYDTQYSSDADSVFFRPHTHKQPSELLSNPHSNTEAVQHRRRNYHHQHPREYLETQQAAPSSPFHSTSVPFPSESIGMVDPIASGIFCEAASTEFDERGLKYHSTDHGVTIIIPENAVAGKATLRVGVSLVGPFHFPENYRPVSAVVWIDINVPLRKCAELHMPHFALLENEKDTKKLNFFLASDQSFATCSEYEFTKVVNYPVSFKPGSNYGTLWVDHFCSGCILEEVDAKETKCLYYIARAFPKDRSQDEWMEEFVFSYYLPTCMETIGRQYPEESYCLQATCGKFTDATVFLGYTPNPEGGWEILQDMPGQQISEEQIDYSGCVQHVGGSVAAKSKFLRGLEKYKQYPPRLSLRILRPYEVQKHLKTEVSVNGVVTKADLPLRFTVLARVLPGHLNVAQGHEHETFGSYVQGDGDLFLRDVILSIQDECEVFSNWFTFGLLLKLQVNELQVLQSEYNLTRDHRHCVRGVLIKWRNKFPEAATWDTIIKVLKEMEAFTLAQKLERKHPPSPLPPL